MKNNKQNALNENPKGKKMAEWEETLDEVNLINFQKKSKTEIER